MSNIEELSAILKKFPGLGSKSAKRIVFHLLNQSDEDLKHIGSLISNLKESIKTCSECGNVSDKDPCNICSDPLRDRKTLCLVESVEALSAFEEAGIYNGLYHVLNHKSSSPDDDLDGKTVEFLLKHLRSLKPDEIIIATSPKLEGDIVYYTILDVLDEVKVPKISRLAFGIPIGGSIELSDKMTLHTALEARRRVK